MNPKIVIGIVLATMMLALVTHPSVAATEIGRASCRERVYGLV